MTIIYQPKTLEWTKSRPDICNTNNHNREEITQEFYISEISKTHKDKWIREFPDLDDTIVHSFTASECRDLFEASKIGVIKSDRSSLHEEELMAIQGRLPVIDGPKFIRLSECSPKDGIHQEGPMLTPKNIIDAIITSKRCLNPLHAAVNSKSGLCLYITPWNTTWMDQGIEFRVFVCQGRITAISQYHWHQDKGLDLDKMVIISGLILDFFGVHAEKIGRIVDSCVMDVIYVNDEIQLVEFNPFGKHLSSGSALFHWLDDEEALYNQNGDVYVRYIVA